MTVNQIAALKHLIFVSRVGTTLSKRIMWCLINESKGLTEEVCLTLTEDQRLSDKEEIHNAAYGIDGMRSANCQTHIDEIMVAMGSKLHFSLHYGDFNPRRTGDPFNSDGQFAGCPREMIGSQDRVEGLTKEGMPLRFTFWLSKKSYSRNVRFVETSRAELEKIGLYEPEIKYS